jgi:tetratricopeptide (TPR) repeat protein
VLSVAPGNFRAHGVLGNYRLASGDLEAAEKHYQKAIELDPSFPSAHLGFARLLAQLGRDGDAEQQFQIAVELEPDYPLAFDSWGNFYARQGKYDQALEKYQQAVQVDPEFTLAHFHRGVALLEKREFGSAKAALETALGLSPKFTQAKVRLAEILASAPDASLRDGRRALSLVNEVVAGVRNPDAKMLDVLAMAYAETSQFSQALEAARHARHLALAADDRDLVRALDERQAIYKKQQPFRLGE